MVLRVSAASCQKGLHRVPDLNLLSSWRLQPLERNQGDESCGMQRRIENPVCGELLYERASWLEIISVSVICLSEDFDESRLVSRSDLRVLSPPICGVVEKVLQRFLVLLFLEALLANDLLFQSNLFSGLKWLN